MPPTPWGTTEGGAARGMLTWNGDGRGTVHAETLQCEGGHCARGYPKITKVTETRFLNRSNLINRHSEVASLKDCVRKLIQKICRKLTLKLHLWKTVYGNWSKKHVENWLKIMPGTCLEDVWGLPGPGRDRFWEATDSWWRNGRLLEHPWDVPRGPPGPRGIAQME